MTPKIEFKEAFQYKETNCTIISDNEHAVKRAIVSIKHHIKKIEKYAKNNPLFYYSLRPVPVSMSNAPLAVRTMAEAAGKANVGPMAAVAGVLADLAVKDMVRYGSKMAVVENGGEVSAISSRPIYVALSAGDSLLSRRVGFRLTDFPIGVATSSGKFSHALSFGEAEAVTIFSKNAGLADAAATAVGNLIKGEDCRRAIQQGIQRALSIQGVDGVFIIYRGMTGMAGRVPQIVKVNSALT
ncbi:MAG: UPF0280 family protein [Candidatus Bathycorpusculaceae bacterium]